MTIKVNSAASIVTLLAISGPIAANNIQFELGIETAYTDNAENLATNTLSERQDRLSFTTTADYKNSWLTADVNYGISQLLFSKDSQDERTELQGAANFLLGKENGRFNLSIQNSKRQVLGNAGELGVADNFQTRDVTSLTPRFNVFRDEADTFSISGIYTAVNFDQNRSTANSFDTTASGAQLSWLRKISKVDSLELLATHQDIDYDDLPSADYEYQSLVLKYATELRQLSYSIAVGYNSADPNIGNKDSSIRWEIMAAYNSGGNSIRFLSESYLTDTSRGNQNSLLEEGGSSIALGNGSTSILDQYNRKTSTLSFTTETLCQLCTASITASHSTESYNTNSAEDNDELFLEVRGNYQLSRLSQLGLSFSHRKADYNASSQFSSFDSDTVTLSYNRQATEKLNLQLRLSDTDRSGNTSASDFSETRFILGITYQMGGQRN